jgi:hypothetical protein
MLWNLIREGSPFAKEFLLQILFTLADTLYVEQVPAKRHV